MSRFEELKRKAKDQIFLGIAEGEVENERIMVVIDEITYYCSRYSSDEVIDEVMGALDENWEEKSAKTSNAQSTEDRVVKIANGAIDEIGELIESRSNGTYNDISNTASAIIKALGTDSEYTYFFSQIANKLARVKNGYSVEDSLLDIAGYAKLELDKFRGENEG